MYVEIGLAIIIAIILIRWKVRGYFWKDKEGNHLSFKEFIIRWKMGLQGITPLQQKKIALWSFIPLFAGILWGISITLFARTYWLSLILCGSLPLTVIQFISTLQQYWSIKKIEEVMQEAK